MKAVDRSVKTPRWLALVVAVCAGVVLMPTSIVRTAAVPILEPVQTSVAGRLSVSAPSTGAKRSRLVNVNLYPLPSPGTSARSREDDLELALFPDVTVRAVFERFDTVGGSGTWIGHVEGVSFGSVTLAYRDGLMTGTVNTHEGTFDIRPALQGDAAHDGDRPLHIVSETDTNALLRGPDIAMPSSDASAHVPPMSMNADSGDVVDLMVVYTRAAMAQVGGGAAMDNFIALGISSTNAAYARSGINHQLRLVHRELVPYVEANKSFQALGDLRSGLEGLSSIPALRDAHGADLVTLVADTTGFPFAGVGHLGMEFGRGRPDLGFSVVCASSASCASFVLPHELGHNMGAAHDWYESGGFRSEFSFGYGHIDLVNRRRTIMAYNNLCGDQGFVCEAILYFSNPELEFVPFCTGTTFNCDLLRSWFYPRAPIGIPEGSRTDCRAGVVPSEPCQADNRRLHNTTARIVANYRQSR